MSPEEEATNKTLEHGNKIFENGVDVSLDGTKSVLKFSGKTCKNIVLNVERRVSERFSCEREGIEQTKIRGTSVDLKNKNQILKPIQKGQSLTMRKGGNIRKKSRPR